MVFKIFFSQGFFHSFSEEILPNIQTDPLLVHLETIETIGELTVNHNFYLPATYYSLW